MVSSWAKSDLILRIKKVLTLYFNYEDEPNQGRSKEYVRVRFVRNIQN